MVYIGLNRRPFREVVACRFVARFFAYSTEVEPWPQILVVLIAALVISARWLDGAARDTAMGAGAIRVSPRGPARPFGAALGRRNAAGATLPARPPFPPPQLGGEAHHGGP